MGKYIKLLNKIVDKKSIKILCVIVGIILCIGIIEPLVAWLYKIFGDYAGHFSHHKLDKIIVVVILYELLQSILQIVSTLKDHWLLKISYKLSENVFEHIHQKVKKLKIEEFENETVFNLLERIDTKLGDETVIAITTLFEVVANIISISIYSIMLGQMKVYFPFVVIVSAIPGIYLGSKKNKCKFNTAKEFFTEERKKEYFLNVVFGRENVKDVKLLELEKFFYEKAKSLNNLLTNKYLKINKKYGYYEIVTNVLKYIVFGWCMYETFWMVYNQSIGLGSILLLVNVFQLLTQELENLTNIIKEIMNVTWLIDEWEGFLQLPEKIWGNKLLENYSISFENVTYKYPASLNYALKNISVKIRDGEKIAIVGENGSGKSTFINILLGLYTVSDGKIRIGNVDINEISKESMKKIVCVFQNYIKYQTSIEENITLGEKKINFHNPFIKALELNELLKSFEKGEKTKLGQLEENGTEISGGQWQKLAISRGVNRESKILILDEPTASLDPLIENKLYENIAELCKDKTLLLISHRMSACRVCDRILTFSNGQIVENGSFDELIERKGKFYEMYMAQKECY